MNNSNFGFEEKENFVPMNAVQRILGVIFSPIKTMKNIAQKPDFIVPLIFITIIFIAYTALTYNAGINYIIEEATKQLEASGQDLPAEQLEAANKMVKIFSSVSLLSIPILNILGILIIAAISLFILNVILKGQGSFKGYFSVVTYGSIISIIGIIIKLIIFYALDDYLLSASITTLKGVLPSNSEINFINTFAASIDFFAIWSYIIIGIGFKYVSKLSTMKVTMFITICYLLYLMAMAASALVSTMFT